MFVDRINASPARASGQMALYDDILLSPGRRCSTVSSGGVVILLAGCFGHVLEGVIFPSVYFIVDMLCKRVSSPFILICPCDIVYEAG